MPESVLITGASGLLGANLALAAAARGSRVIGAVHSNPLRLPEVEPARLNLGVRGRASALVRETRPDWVIHCAALTNVDRCESHPEEAYGVNVEGSRELADAARQHGGGIIYVSTDAVFQGDRGGYREEDTAEPVNEYARSKLAGEAAVAAANPRHVVVRTNMFGWDPLDRQRLAEWVLGRLESGAEISGFEDVWFNPLLVNHLAGILLDLTEGDRTGTVHAAARDRCSKLEFARMIADVFGYDPEAVRPASVEKMDFKATRPRDTTLETERLTEWLGRPVPTVREGIERFRELRESGYADNLKAVAIDNAIGS